jgi:integrase/recombinase XerC
MAVERPSAAGASEPRSDAKARAARWLTEFIDHLAYERRLAALTAKAYRRDLERLIALAGETALERIDVHAIQRMVASLHAQGLSGRSIARLLSAWRGFFAFLARRHGIAHNPCNAVRAPKSPKRLPNALSPDEAGRLVAVPGDGMMAVRDRAILELFYSSGLRLAELAGMDWDRIDWREGTARVHGKGGKTRVVPVGRYALAALQAWRRERERLPQTDPAALFVNRRGRRLSARTLQVRVKARGLRAGIAARVHPHALRHSFASHVLQSSGDLRAVQEMLGHASIASTQIYTHLDFQALAKVYDAAHPRARRKSR